MKQDKIKKVMIALDHDPTALKVAHEGFTMAKMMGAEVILLHVIINSLTYSLTYLNMGSLQLNSVEEFKDDSQKFIEKPKHFPGKSIIQNIIKAGDFAVSILNSAREMEVDIIIMGSHSTKWLQEIIMGRITNEVLQQNKIPILIIPTRRRDKRYTFISLEH